MLSLERLFPDALELDESELFDLIPLMNPPPKGSRQCKKDTDDVIFYYTNPSLGNGFLSTSHESINDIFEAFCHEAGIHFNVNDIRPALKEVKKVTKFLKNKFKRLRPKHQLLDMSDRYDDIDDMNSYSFPSGHTCKAYFLAGVLSSKYPDLRKDFETIAELIGQSRIENAVHYPSDVSYGKLLGETLSDAYLQDNNLDFSLSEKRKTKNDKDFADFLREMNESNFKKTADDISNFLYLTLQIENLEDQITFSKCFDAAKNLMTSMPDKKLSDNHLIRSQCKCLREAYYMKNYSPEGCIRIHRQMSEDDLERGTPGEMRSYDHYSPTGIKYSSPEMIYRRLSKLESCDDPILRHALFEWVHPFCDGNGRSGRIVLCADLGFDFETVNRIMNNNYISALDNFYHNNDIIKLFN